MNLQELHIMPLHARSSVDTNISVLRVASGWLYQGMIGPNSFSVFVPEPKTLPDEAQLPRAHEE